MPVTYPVNQSLDCKGLSCPMPIVQTKKAMTSLQPGQVLEVVATDPGSVADIRSWAARTGQQYLGTVTTEEGFYHYLRKSVPEEERDEVTYPHVVSNEELLATLSQNPLIIDVREPMEYAFGHIPGAISIPFGNLAAALPQLRNEVRSPMFVICRSAHRSDAACQALSQAGFDQVKNVVPGMAEWQGPITQDLQA